MLKFLFKLKFKNLSDVDSDILLKSLGKHTDLIINLSNKNLGKRVPKKFSPAIRQFTLSMHFFSPNAYQFVSKQFNTILPHPCTLGKWCCKVDAEPGFTDEALKSLNTLKLFHLL